MNKIIYYYQTFTGLLPILNSKQITVTHIYISSIHFGINKDKSLYIHLNDNPPDDSKFNTLWNECKLVSNKGITIMLMMGGAGGAYNTLFSNFENYYKMLKNTIIKYNIKGIDLDVEEETKLSNIKLLINRLDSDFGKDFIITMAPVGNSLIFDSTGLGGFSYKDLYNSKEGKRINWFNGQFYYMYNEKYFKQAVSNGYPANKIVFGMIASEFSKSTFPNALQTISNIKKTYNNFGGVFVWEYYYAPPLGSKNPNEWSKEIYNTINKTK